MHFHVSLLRLLRNTDRRFDLKTFETVFPSRRADGEPALPRDSTRANREERKPRHRSAFAPSPSQRACRLILEKDQPGAYSKPQPFINGPWREAFGSTTFF